MSSLNEVCFNREVYGFFLLIEPTAGIYRLMEGLSDIAFLLVQSGVTRQDRLGLVGEHANFSRLYSTLHRHL